MSFSHSISKVLKKFLLDGSCTTQKYRAFLFELSSNSKYLVYVSGINFYSTKDTSNLKYLVYVFGKTLLYKRVNSFAF